MEFKFVCDKKECQEYFNKYHIYSIKRSRHISTSYFNLYDLDRPLAYYKDGQPSMYERVCRICGGPLKNKNGKYSYQRRYCREHDGSGLWAKYNWGETKWRYILELQEKQEKELKSYKDQYPTTPGYAPPIVLCEICRTPCKIYQYKRINLDVINVHHKIPVHTLNLENLSLIWDYDNLIALCQDCHHQQDHQLSKMKMDELSQFKKITDYFEVKYYEK
jgi:5-methylcytosine-specific restriction endonuclease McrA